MENISYHGTDLLSAKSIIGPPANVDVSKGRGELGQGFYAGSSIALASIWAYNRYSNNGIVLEFNIDRSEFVKLRGLVINKRNGLLRIWDELRKKRTTKTHKFGYDYIIAPFATIEEVGHQIKFESDNARIALNNSQITGFKCV